jgi:hypothetical protein
MRIGAWVGVVAAAIVVALAAPAVADVPQHFEGTTVDSGVIDCGTFLDRYTDYRSFSGTTYFDASGNPVRVVLHIRGTSDDTDSVTGFTLHEFDTQNRTIDYANGTFTITGGLIRMRDRGLGLVFQDVGRLVFSYPEFDEVLFWAGFHDQFDGDEAFCRALTSAQASGPRRSA